MKIKNSKKVFLVYDVYYGFTGLPTTWPFCTKWIIDKFGISREEVLRYIENYTINTNDKFIIKL